MTFLKNVKQEDLREKITIGKGCSALLVNQTFYLLKIRSKRFKKSLKTKWLGKRLILRLN